MPSIMIVTKPAHGGDATVLLAERLTTVQLDDPHFAAQLVERLKWAGADAERAEREAAGRPRNLTRVNRRGDARAHPPSV